MRLQILIAAVCLVVLVPLCAASSTPQSPPPQQASTDKTLDAVVKLIPTLTSLFRNVSWAGGKSSSGLKRFGSIMQIFIPVMKHLTVFRAKEAGRPVDRKQLELFETFEFFTQYLNGVAESGGSLDSLTSNPETLLQDYTDLAVEPPKFTHLSAFLPGGDGENPRFIPQSYKTTINPKTKAERERPTTLIGHVREETDTATQTVDYVTRRPSSRSRPHSSSAQQKPTTTRRPNSNRVAFFASAPGLTYNPSSTAAAPSPNYAINVQFPPTFKPKVQPTPQSYAQTEKPTTERYTPRRPSKAHSSSATRRPARFQTAVPEVTKAESRGTERYEALRISRPKTSSSIRQHSSTTSHQPASARQQSSSARQLPSSTRQQSQRPQYNQAEAETRSSSRVSTSKARAALHPITDISGPEVDGANAAAGISFFKLPGHSYTYSSLGTR